MFVGTRDNVENQSWSEDQDSGSIHSFYDITANPLDKQASGSKSDKRRRLIKEDVQVTLWGDVARTVDVDAIRTTPPPALAVFTSLKVTKYPNKIALSNTGNTFFFLNPDIKEAEDYKHYFGEPHHAARILSSQPKQPRTPAELQAVKQMSVSNLNICDPNNYKNKPVYCTAKIAKFVPEERWFYLACPKCFKEMRKKPQSQLLICTEHDMQQPLYR
ncbi:hypothetical protein ABKV19_026375 [Rosa sericea]